MKFEEILARDGRLVYKTKGVSMEPMLHQERDLIIIKPARSRLKKFDVALYRRGKDYVLHRVIGHEGNVYLIRGDNTYCIERVPESAVIGVLSRFVRKGREISVKNGLYQMYVRVWHGIYPLREKAFALRRFAVGIARKLGVLPLIKKILGRA